METKNNKISMEEYRYYVNALDLKDALERLKGKCIYSENIEDCGVNFVKDLLKRDWGRSIVYTYTKRELDFIKSKYLSDYFKDSIKELLNNTTIITKEIEDILNSSKDINQMSEEEVKMLKDAISEYYRIYTKSPKPNISGIFVSYLFKLDGNGVTSFIKNNINREAIASQILLTSGLNDRASFYSGRGVMYCDLNEQNLVAIFGKLLKLETCYAIAFVDMVYQMNTLGATEFINTFMSFASNGFKNDTPQNKESNISLNGAYEEARDTVAFVSIFSAVSRGNDTAYQISASETMKHLFISRIRPVLMEIDQEFDDNHSQTPNSYGYKKRR